MFVWLILLYMHGFGIHLCVFSFPFQTWLPTGVWSTNKTKKFVVSNIHTVYDNNILTNLKISCWLWPPQIHISECPLFHYNLPPFPPLACVMTLLTLCFVLLHLIYSQVFSCNCVFKLLSKSSSLPTARETFFTRLNCPGLVVIVQRFEFAVPTWARQVGRNPC